jgi:hypothetical protein
MDEMINRLENLIKFLKYFSLFILINMILYNRNKSNISRDTLLIPGNQMISNELKDWINKNIHFLVL